MLQPNINILKVIKQLKKFNFLKLFLFLNFQFYYVIITPTYLYKMNT